MLYDINVERVKQIFKNYIFVKKDFENLASDATKFIKNYDFKKFNIYLKLVENEMIIPLKNGNFSMEGYLNENSSLENLFFNGLIGEKKETMIEDYNFFVYYGVSDKDSYNSKINIENEISRIISDIDEKKILENFLKNKNNNIADEFLNINNKRARMFTNANAILYSNLLNYSKADIQRSKIYTDSDLLENWDILSVLLRKFLKEIDTRTIHY